MLKSLRIFKIISTMDKEAKNIERKTIEVARKPQIKSLKLCQSWRMKFLELLPSQKKEELSMHNNDVQKNLK